jgi:hypothetical protein
VGPIPASAGQNPAGKRSLPLGLLFAGSDNTTIINRIEHVFSALGVSR